MKSGKHILTIDRWNYWLMNKTSIIIAVFFVIAFLLISFTVGRAYEIYQYELEEQKQIMEVVKFMGEQG